MNVDSATRRSRWLIGVLMGLAWLHALPTAASAEPLPLPQGERLISPWTPMLSLTGGTVEPDEAAGFRLADDAKVGRALVVGPWLAGAWWARAQYEKPFPPLPTEVWR